MEDVQRLRHRAGQLVRFEFDVAPPLAGFEALPELGDLQMEGATLTAVLRGSPDGLLKEAARHTVLRWSAQDRNLEELFMDHYRQPAETP